MRKIVHLSVLFVTIFMLSSVKAGVNIKNRNFFVSYTDIFISGYGKKLKIQRTYNSKSNYVGWFSSGWGSLYETFLEVSGDGSVVINEHGSGSKTRFVPQGEIDVEQSVDKIIAKLVKKSGISDVATKRLRKNLKQDASLRHRYAKSVGLETLLANGSVLFSTKRGPQKLTKTKEGFQRKLNSQVTDFFNNEGLLVKRKSSDWSVMLSYGKNKKPSMIKDNFGNQMKLSWNGDNFVSKICSPVSKVCSEYKYRSNDLIESKDVVKNVYQYKYDKNHNMTSIVTPPKNPKGKQLVYKIKYDRKGDVTQIIQRNGNVVKYGLKKKGPLKYAITVEKKNFNNKPIKNVYSYEIRKRSDGQKYTYRITSTISGVKTDTIFLENALPSKISRGRIVTNFKYDKKGRLLEKTSSDRRFTKMAYSKKGKCDKISKITNNKGWAEFSYDAKCNLVSVKNSQGEKIRLVYNSAKTISSVVAVWKKKKTVVDIAYNAQKKPSTIDLKGVGKLNITYNSFGQIKNVKSNKGRGIAPKISRVFGKVIAMVKPAGVNLSL